MTVYLVGAGPGDPGLVTVRGAEALARADVVVFDRLAPPALLELEVLDHVGHVGLGALDARGLQPAVELATGGADERPARQVLLVAGLLADQHHARAFQALAEDSLGCAAPEVAAAAAGRRLAERLERAALGQERCGVVRFWAGSDRVRR